MTFDDGYLGFYQFAYPMLLKYGVKGVVFVLGNRNIKKSYWNYEKGKTPAAPLMNDHHIKELYKKGFEIGAHSLSHLSLKELNEVQLKNEIRKSKIILESLTGDEIHSFSYPFGHVDERVKDRVAQFGFNFGCSVFSGSTQICR